MANDTNVLGLFEKVRKFIMDHVLYCLMVLMVVLLTVVNPNFLSPITLRDILMQSAPRLIVASGIMFVIIMGGVDLSAGRMVGLAAVIAGSLAQQATYYLKFWPSLPELHPIICILAAMALGAVVGILNGLIVGRLRVVAFLATLGMQMILFGALNILMYKPPNSSQPLGGYTAAFTRWGSGSIGFMPIIILVSLICVVLVWIMQTKTNYGHQLFCVGGNREAARVSGISIFKVEFIAYMLAGLFYGLAGALEAARTGSANPTYGLSYEMDGIASCIIGGISMGGGQGNVLGVMMGVLVFNLINYGLTFVGINAFYQYVFKGLVIIFAISLDMRKLYVKA